VGRWLPGRAYRLEGLDAAGRPMRDKAGAARLECRLGADGKEVERTWWTLDLQNRLTLTLKKNGAGKVLEECCFTTGGKPVLFAEGYHRWTAKYDEPGNQLGRAFFGTDGKPCLSVWGQHRFTEKYDERGNRIEAAFFGIDGEPCLHRSGVHRWTAKFDERGNQVEFVNFGTDGQLINNKEGFARRRKTYDGKGQLRETAYWVATPEGTLALQKRQDGAGRVLEEAFFTPDGKAALFANGQHRWTLKYDERGNRIEGANFGLDGKPCLTRSGVHRWAAKYDERGNKFEEATFGLHGTLVNTELGFARKRWIREPAGEVMDVERFTADGKPVRFRVLVHNVTPGSVGDKAGLRAGDILVEVGAKDSRGDNLSKLLLPGGAALAVQTA
jgi:hypothetical protein